MGIIDEYRPNFQQNKFRFGDFLIQQGYSKLFIF